MKKTPLVSIISADYKDKVYAVKVRRWLMFPVFWKAFLIFSKDRGCLAYIIGFFFTIHAYLKFIIYRDED
jgi:hypothetical protein